MLNKTSRNKKIFKWIISSVLVLSVLVVSVAWYISAQLKPIIKKELKELVINSTNGLYHLNFSDLHTNLITGSATLLDVDISPDTNVYNKLILQKKAPNNLYYIKLKKISIKRFHPFNIFFNREVAVNLLLFDKPDVTMVNKQFEFNENKPPRPEKSPYDFIKKLFKAIRVDVVDFKNSRFKYVNNNGTIPEIDSVANLNVSLRDWLIDSLSAQDKSRFYLLKDVNLNVNNYSFATPDSMYHINVNQLSFNAASGIVNIKEFGLIPRFSEKEFSRINGYARDRYTIKLNDISFDGLDLPAYLRKREVIAKQMQIANGGIAVYNDNSYPSPKRNRTGRFPHQLLQLVNAQITIDKIKLKNVNVSYAEFDRDSKHRGEITFDHTSGTIINVTNVDKIKKAHPFMQADLTTYVMEEGKMDVSFKFDLKSPLGAFDYKGSLTNLDGRKLNQITKPLGMVQVNKGTINELAFNVKANQDIAKGTLDFRFKDLSVALLKKVEGKERLVKQGLLSILANALVIDSDNPNKKGKFTSATVNYKRKETASFFSFIWRSLFEGVKYSVGVTPKKEAEIDAQVSKFEKMIDDRDERRMRRQIRIDKRKN